MVFYRIVNVAMYGMPWTYILKSLINFIGLVIIWSTIRKLQGVGSGLGNPNLVYFNCFVIIFTPYPPSNRTSLIVFMSIFIWITAMWLFISTSVVLMLSTINIVTFSFIALVFIYGLSTFKFAASIFSTLVLFLSIVQDLRYNWFPTFSH